MLPSFAKATAAKASVGVMQDDEMLCLASFAAASRFPWLNAGRPQQRRCFTSDNFKAERFQHFHRCNADVRFVIPHKCVVPKNDVAAAVAAGVDGGGHVGSPFLVGGRGHRPRLQYVC